MSPLVVALLLAASPAARTLTFTEALEKAEAQNLDLQVARARLDQARSHAGKAWAGYLPQVSVGGSYTRNSDEAKMTLPIGFYIRDMGVPTSPADPQIPGQPTTLQQIPAQFIETVIQ